ncbi:pyridoxal-phosphate dependent enzyme [Ensifer soli]|uniref:pyridoxal-phosphate dependent enzyme n=1 Tax=Ciceribacter sp. sgz301302 TaxID=3342379 RepID=UPI0035B7F4C8
MKTIEGGLAGTRLSCFFCATARAPDLGTQCLACGGSLAAVVDPAAPFPLSVAGFWDYAPVLPVGDARVSLGEGSTALLKLDRLMPGDEVYVKAEWMGPTGSFKDRGSAVAVSAARALGAVGVICASTGNNAASVSAYAARAGLPCVVALPKGTPANKIIQAKAHGAIVLEVEGTFSDAYACANRIQAASPGWANLTSTYLNPYMTAAHATIFYECEAELGEVGTIVVPIGAGPMLDGILQGARLMRDQGLIETLPVPVGVQGEGCAPIAEAFSRGLDHVEEWAPPVTGMPGSINDPLRGYAADGTRTLAIIRAAGGHAVAVSDDEIRRAMLDLGRSEGIAAEPASVTPLAALRRLDHLPRPVVLVVSGHALKDGAAQAAAGAPSLDIDADADPQAVTQAALGHFSQKLRA